MCFIDQQNELLIKKNNNISFCCVLGRREKLTPADGMKLYPEQFFNFFYSLTNLQIGLESHNRVKGKNLSSNLLPQMG